MNQIKQLLTWFKPIPTEHKQLETVFHEEGLQTLKKIIRAVGIIWLLYNTVTLIFFLDPSQYESEFWYWVVTLIVYVPMLLACIIWLVSSMQAINQQKTYWLVLIAHIMYLIPNVLIAALFSGSYQSLGMFFVFTPVLTLIPWSTQWVLKSVYSLILIFMGNLIILWQMPHDNLGDPGIVFATIVTIIIFVFLHLFLTKQRWDSFYNRHKVQQLTTQLQNELALAHNIQKTLLPPPIPNWSGLQLVCYSQPARQVGGDFYRYYAFPNKQAIAESSLAQVENRYAIVVGDVSGKGVSAALLMAASLSKLDAHLLLDSTPTQLMVELDQALMPYTKPRKQNCALCYVEVLINADKQLPKLNVINAGCIPPFIKKKDGSIQWLDIGGFALGQGLGSIDGYKALTVSLEAGDMVILSSDGVVEAVNTNNKMFGFERLEQSLKKSVATTPQDLLTNLLADVNAFVDKAEAQDDLTLVIFKV